MFDLVIANGTVFDGTGAEARTLDIGISGGRIQAMGDLSGADSESCIDAANMFVCPGFIDIHTHNDEPMENNSMAENYLRQGITTVVGGNCGIGPQPLADHFNKVATQEKRTNYACLACANDIHQAVSMETRPFTSDEVKQMKNLLKDDFEAGAVGFSSGVRYMPFFTTSELIELAKTASEYNSFYASHIRNESDTLLESVEELITIAGEGGVPGHVSHIKCLGKVAAGKSDSVIQAVQEAQQQGLDITADLYPYDASSNSLLGSMVGHDNLLRAEFAGGKEALLNDESIRQAAEICFRERYQHFGDGKSILLGPEKRKKEWQGKSLADYLQAHQGNPYEEVVKLCLDQEVTGVYLILSNPDLENFLKQDWVMASSDGLMDETDGPYAHPRNFGAFPRFIAHYVNRKNILTMAGAIKKMTSMPAKRLGFEKRGILKQNMIADIVIFDPVNIKDKATYKKCKQSPEGFKWVVIGGNIALKDDVPSEKGFGQLIRRGES
jgi:N-acyl-D-aspartate/D-glutamate deacylase